jgi:DNA gyrase subunit A
MRFRGDDELVSADVARPEGTLLIVTSAGFGKRTPADRYPTKGRGGLGVIGIRITEQRGVVAAAFMVNDGDEVFLVASGGVIIRIPVSEISVQGRDATGVRVMNLDDGQYIAAAALVQERDDENGDNDEGPSTADGDAADDIVDVDADVVDVSSDAAGVDADTEVDDDGTGPESV